MNPEPTTIANAGLTPDDADAPECSAAAVAAQTPGSPSSSSSSPAGVPQSYVRRSCFPCSRKKIRCDRKQPCCSACSRAGRSCAFPPAGPRVRRTKKTIMADMASRISSLEQSLAKARRGGAKGLGDDVAVGGGGGGGGGGEGSGTTSQAAPAPVPASASQSASQSPKSVTGTRTREGILVEKGSSSYYFNEVLLSRVIREEQDIESVLSTPQTQSSQKPTSSPFNPAGILSAVALAQEPCSFHPPKRLSVRLWNIYMENVDPCSPAKFLHIPTDKVKIYSVINDPPEASFEDLALGFAVYFAATATIEEAEVRVVLGRDKDELLSSLKLGIEQAFAHGDFLDRPTLTGLQALAIYLTALRIKNRGKGMWILNGLAVRMAQSLGLHRDGKHLGLPPFQAEMRRRLWWHLVARDNRSGEDFGLENTNGRSFTYDVDLPLNVEDTDLHPDMSALPPERPGFTSMTFTLGNLEIARAMSRLSDLFLSATTTTTTTSSSSSSSSSSPQSSAPTPAAASSSTTSPTATAAEQTRSRIMRETRQRIESRLRDCNPLIPQQRLALSCSDFILRKVDFVTRLQWARVLHHQQHQGHHQQQHQQQQGQEAVEENLVEALEILEPQLADFDYDYDGEEEEGEEEGDREEGRGEGRGKGRGRGRGGEGRGEWGGAGLLTQFSWARKAYPQNHVTMYVLWHLCVRPEGPSVQRAWRAIDKVFARDFDDPSMFGSKAAVLMALRAKAKARRAAARAKVAGAAAARDNNNTNNNSRVGSAVTTTTATGTDEVMADSGDGVDGDGAGSIGVAFDDGSMTATAAAEQHGGGSLSAYLLGDGSGGVDVPDFGIGSEEWFDWNTFDTGFVGGRGESWG
ncbi:hypothetical protein F4778DRAFT_785304 [Xylariomycetidae sp. FL2044]|nr:hypothetical protein F4778DRAFT_785304 [Xylariomycetidae sp. FL2044]